MPVSRFDNADRKTMKSLQANPECQLLNATSVLAALNYHILSVVSLLNIVGLFCQSLYEGGNNTGISAASYLNGIYSRTEINVKAYHSHSWERLIGKIRPG